VGSVSYTLLAGEFVIRYADRPRGGPEPDGDTIKFAPASPALVDTLPRVSGRAPDLNSRGISVRLEAIDALETHFAEAHQELAGANGARDRLLSELGFRDVTFFADLPNKVQSASRDALPGHVLSNGIDANGRMIGFVFEGVADEPDGSRVFLDAARVDRSVNARLLAAGQAYPAFYATLPGDLRAHLADVSRAARAARSPAGIWPRSTADPDAAASVADLPALEELVLWPKLFRRIVPYLAAGFSDFDAFDAWLRADPTDRDDALFLLDRLERGNLHDVVRARGQTVQLTVWPEDFIIEPDPVVPTPAPSPTPARVADVLIVAALPNPNGADDGAESVTLLNTSSARVDLTGWALSDADGRQRLGGDLDAGATARVRLTAAVRLANLGDTIRLADAGGQVIDEVAYQRNQAREGHTIAFGRER
jgi:endonuclease YncB( thermonuclease family)